SDMANKLDPMDLKQIISLHVDGHSNRSIAKTLCISRNTVVSTQRTTPYFFREYPGRGSSRGLALWLGICSKVWVSHFRGSIPWASSHPIPLLSSWSLFFLEVVMVIMAPTGSYGWG
ncbi:MAG: hypothetical protein OIF50_08030, partial [Flavobacteriaceae bacterium]|nr:hypothetical protein [Flavobacteriaceae bacterium]